MQTRLKHMWIVCAGLLLVASAAGCTDRLPATISEAVEAQSDDGREAVTAEDNAPEAGVPEAGGPEAGWPEAGETAARPAGWSEDSHGNDAEPNYEVVFPQDQVNQLTITIAAEDWAAMQANMTELFGEAGSMGGFGEQPGEFAPRDGMSEGFEPPEGFAPPEGGPGSGQFAGPPGGGGNFARNLTPENPMWVPATIEFDGNTWTDVGVRYKGNSSLASGWSSGDAKLPFKLDFDQFEDENPAIEDQRFYGFKQLSLANGFADASFMRDSVSADILAEAGLPAAETAYYEVILDYGEGPVSLGLYTVIEVVDDTVVDRVYGSDDGNIYEAEGAATTFAAATYDQIEEGFQKENNEDEADFSDIQALFDALHSDLRTSDPEAWRAQLEAVFDVNNFLEWLAVSAVIEHWDAYGNMSHNYYLYNDPATGQLEWISWDHNMAMSSGGMGGEMRIIGGPEGEADGDVLGGPGPGGFFFGPGGEAGPEFRGGPGAGVSLDKDDVSEEWPLIRFLLDDPVYYERYLDYLEETVSGPFEPEWMAERYRALAELIAPFAAADVGQEAFDAAVQELIDHAYERAEEVEVFLESVGR